MSCLSKKTPPFWNCPCILRTWLWKLSLSSVSPPKSNLESLPLFLLVIYFNNFFFFKRFSLLPVPSPSFGFDTIILCCFTCPQDCILPPFLSIDLSFAWGMLYSTILALFRLGWLALLSTWVPSLSSFPCTSPSLLFQRRNHKATSPKIPLQQLEPGTHLSMQFWL